MAADPRPDVDGSADEIRAQPEPLSMVSPRPDPLDGVTDADLDRLAYSLVKLLVAAAERANERQARKSAAQ